MKRWLLVAAVVSLASLAIPALAAQSDKHDAGEWDALLGQYDIRTVDAAPAGITPLEIGTPAELRQFMRHITSHGTSRLEIESASPAFLTYGITESCVSLHTSRSWVPFPTFNLWADVWIIGSGSFWEIGDVFEWVGLTGITVFSDLTSEWHYHIVSTDHRSVIIKGGGIVNHYFFIKGLTRLYSQAVSLALSYSLR
jgi:hypothetical protein